MPFSGSEPRNAESLRERQKDATSACREGGNGGCEQGLGEDQRVGQAKRGLAEQGNDVVGDAVAETCLDETTRQEEGERNKPGNLRRERTESGGERQQAGHHGDTKTDHRGSTEGKRLRGRRIVEERQPSDMWRGKKYLP